MSLLIVPVNTMDVRDRVSSEVLLSMRSAGTTADFERLFLPHLNAAYNLARLLTRNAQDAEDIVQESYLRALRAFSTFHGEACRPWLMTIVRNTAFTWLRKNGAQAAHSEFDERYHGGVEQSPETQSLETEQSIRLNRCIEKLPADFREAIALREQEELSYREISEITGAPVGTVMSRLARARARLAQCMAHGLSSRSAREAL